MFKSICTVQICTNCNKHTKIFRKRFGDYFKSIKEEQNLRKVAKSLYIFLTTPDEVEKSVQSNSYDNCMHHYNVEILNVFDPELQLINTKQVIKNKLKELLNDRISLRR